MGAGDSKIPEIENEDDFCNIEKKNVNKYIDYINKKYIINKKPFTNLTIIVSEKKQTTNKKVS